MSTSGTSTASAPLARPIDGAGEVYCYVQRAWRRLWLRVSASNGTLSFHVSQRRAPIWTLQLYGAGVHLNTSSTGKQLFQFRLRVPHGLLHPRLAPEGSIVMRAGSAEDLNVWYRLLRRAAKTSVAMPRGSSAGVSFRLDGSDDEYPAGLPAPPASLAHGC